MMQVQPELSSLPYILCNTTAAAPSRSATSGCSCFELP